jgi:hypothetical protein
MARKSYFPLGDPSRNPVPEPQYDPMVDSAFFVRLQENMNRQAGRK